MTSQRKASPQKTKPFLERSYNPVEPAIFITFLKRFEIVVSVKDMVWHLFNRAQPVDEDSPFLKTVESAGGVIVNELGEVVIVYNNTKSWQFPKGTVKAGEEYLQTALREIAEETGLKELTYVKDLPVYSRISKHQEDTKRIIHYFLFRTKNQLLQPSAEIRFSKWITLDEVDKHLTYPEDRKFIIDAIEDIKQAISKK
jgi:diadenosine hexaphosphate hydrolase (ATP-forming)